MAAVEKIEEKRKPEDFFGHRNRRALGAAAPVRQRDIAVESKVAGVLQTAAAATCKRATAPQGRLLASRSGSGRQMRKALDADEDAGHRNRKPRALPRQRKDLGAGVDGGFAGDQRSPLQSRRGCGGGWRCDYPSVSFADSSPDKGSLGRCRARGRIWVRG